MDQRLQYFGTATLYLTGIAPGILLLVPPLQIYFDLTPINSGVPFSTWLLYYPGLYVMQIVVAFYTIGSFRWETLMLAAVSFPIYGRALVNAVFRKEQKWHVTGAARATASPFNFITHQVWAFAFLLVTSVVGVWQAVTVSSVTLALIWNILNTLVLGLFIVTALHEARAIRRERRRRRRAGRSHQARTGNAARTPAVPDAPRVPALVGAGASDETVNLDQKVSTR